MHSILTHLLELSLLLGKIVRLEHHDDAPIYGDHLRRAGPNEVGRRAVRLALKKKEKKTRVRTEQNNVFLSLSL